MSVIRRLNNSIEPLRPKNWRQGEGKVRGHRRVNFSKPATRALAANINMILISKIKNTFQEHEHFTNFTGKVMLSVCNQR